MRKILLSVIVLIFFCCINLFADAYVRLPDIFSDNMLLQQRTTIRFHGWSDPGEKISIIAGWTGDTLKTVTASDAVWSVDLQTPKAGGPYEITVIGDSLVTIHNVLIGEVWMCTGQSNMEFSADWHLNNYQEEIRNSQHSEIRFFHIQKISAAYPQEEVTGKWEVCTPETMHSFSAAGYFFGRSLNARLHQPVGLIESCWGGTPVEAWMPVEIFRRSEKLAISAAKLTPVPWCPVRPAVCYNAMIAPLTDFPVAGAIWYQGETNTTNPGTYEEDFSKLIHSWRELWQKDFPFYFVQIAPFTYGKGFAGAQVREAQLQTFRKVAKTGIVIVSDITYDTTDIHPKDKQDVGTRLAAWALANTYHIPGIHYSGPLYRSMDINGNKVIIHFDFANDGLIKKGNTLTDFLIAGEDHQFVHAIAEIKDRTVIVFSPKVLHPVAVRMGFTNTAIPNLFNKAGLPASSFRTDNWKLE